MASPGTGPPRASERHPRRSLVASPSMHHVTSAGGTGAAMRTVSLPKAEFELVTNSLFRKSMSMTMSARVGPADPGPAYAPVDAREDGPSVAVNLGAPRRRVAAWLTDEHRSIFGLPILSCRDSWFSLWVLTILLLDLTYSAFLVPLSIGFEVSDLEWTWACFLDLTVGFFFAAELFLGFHVSYFASNAGHRKEVRGGRAIARFYVRRGSFWQDAPSVAVWLLQIVLLIVRHAGGVPITESSTGFDYIRCLRMIRFFTVLQQMSAYVGSGSGSMIPFIRLPAKLAQGLNIAYAVVVLLHLFTCLWNFIVFKEGLTFTWMNTVGALVRRYAADGASPLTAAELLSVPAWERYVIAAYFSSVTIATLGYGDIVPVNVVEWLVCIFLVAVGVLLFGLAMGSLSEVVASQSNQAKQAQLIREKIEGVNAWLHSASVSLPLKHKIRAFYAEVWHKHAASRSSASVEQFKELPFSLRQEVAWELNHKLLSRDPLFRELDDSQRYTLAGMLQPLDVTPGQELCLHGDHSDRIWLLHEGDVQVFDEAEVLNVVSGPAVLGVEALLQHEDAACATRPHGLRTSTTCTLWELTLEELLPYLLANLKALDALSCRAQEQRAAQAEAFQRYAAEAAAAAAEAAAAGEGAVGAALAAGTITEELLEAARLAEVEEGEEETEGGLPFEEEAEGEERELMAGSSFSADYRLGSSSRAVGSPAQSASPRSQPEAEGNAPFAAAGSAWEAAEAAAAAACSEPATGEQQGQLSHPGSGGSGEHQQLSFFAAAEPSMQLQEAAVAAASPLASRPSSPEGFNSPATRGEMLQLMQRLESLGAEMRRAFAAASLAQSVAAQRAAAASPRFSTLAASPGLASLRSRRPLAAAGSRAAGSRADELGPGEQPGGRADS